MVCKTVKLLILIYVLNKGNKRSVTRMYIKYIFVDNNNMLKLGGRLQIY